MSEDEATDKLKELVARCKECKFATCENCEINWNEVQAIETILDLYQKEKEKNKRNKKIMIDKLDKLKNGVRNDFPITLGKQQPLWEDNYTNYISKDKIKDMKRYREFELQQEYKDFENDSEWKTYNKILEEE